MSTGSRCRCRLRRHRPELVHQPNTAPSVSQGRRIWHIRVEPVERYAPGFLPFIDILRNKYNNNYRIVA